RLYHSLTMFVLLPLLPACQLARKDRALAPIRDKPHTRYATQRCAEIFKLDGCVVSVNTDERRYSFSALISKDSAVIFAQKTPDLERGNLNARGHPNSLHLANYRQSRIPRE